MIAKKLSVSIHSFRVKLIFCFLICSVLPLLFIGCIAYSISFHIAESKIVESTLLAHNQLIQNINNRFTQMEKVADSIYSNLYTLNSQIESGRGDYIETFGNARNNMTSLTNTFQFFQTCAFVDSNSLISNEGLMFYGLNELERYKISANELCNIGINSKWLFQEDLVFPIISSPLDRSTNTILCCRSLNEKGILKFAYFVSIKSKELSDLLFVPFENTPIKSYVVTPTGKMVAHNDADFVGFILNTHLFTSLKKNGFQNLLSYEDSRYTFSKLNNGYFLITEIPYSYITENVRILIKMILISTFILIPFVLLITIFITNNLTKKLRHLTKMVQSTHVSGNTITNSDLCYPFQKSLDHYDEVDKLAFAFQSMLGTLRNKVTQIIDLNVQEERLKYQLLQSQINPHFLYNILGSIQICQKVGKLDIAHRMITDLSKFYRLTLRKSGELIPIRDELEITSLYLEMEQLCRKDAFTWDIQMDDGIENFMICKFTIQPFLENSILHGLHSGDQTIHIQINVSFGEDTIIITVLDTGAGIDPDHLEEIRLSLEEKIVNTSKHFGISNVNARIRSSLFGSGTIDIQSQPNRGTEIRIEFAQILEV